MAFQSSFSKDFLAPILCVDAIVLHANNTQQFFGHLAIFMCNYGVTRTYFVLPPAILTYWVKFPTAMPLLFSGPRMTSAYLANQVISKFSQGFARIFVKRCHFDECFKFSQKTPNLSSTQSGQRTPARLSNWKNEKLTGFN